MEINPDKVREIIAGARIVDVKEAVTDPNSGSNPSDDRVADILEDCPDDPSYSELMELIRGLNVDEQLDLVTLAWIGRGTYDVGEWNEARAEAARAHNQRTAEYLISLPMLGDYLEEGLTAVDGSEADY